MAYTLMKTAGNFKAMDAIFFDLDGTLTDPKPGITRSIRYALQRLGHPPFRARTN